MHSSLETSGMKETYLVKVINIILNHRSIGDLSKSGLTYSQIANLFEEAIEKKFIEYDDNLILVVTDHGKNEYSKLKKQLYLQGEGDWILPDTNPRIDKITPLDVYLPRRRK